MKFMLEDDPIDRIIEDAPRIRTGAKRRLGRQQSFGLFLLLTGIICITLSFLFGGKPDLSLFMIGGIWSVGGLFLIVST